MIDTYNTMIHLQPFPLFDPATLLSQLMRWPRYLQNSFLAITLIFSDHPVYFDGEYKAAETYSDLARNEVIPLTTEETSSIEVIKSLCLLALYDTASKYPSCYCYTHVIRSL